MRLSAEGKHGRARWNGVVRFIPEKLTEPLRWTRPRRVFVNSMSDLFHENVPFEQVAAIFGVMAAAPQHTFQVLTKRPERAARFFEWLGGTSGAGWSAVNLGYCTRELGVDLDVDDLEDVPWPLPNVWLGVSVEDQKTAEERIPVLLHTPVAVRWASYEPALGPIDFTMLRYVFEDGTKHTWDVLRGRGIYSGAGAAAGWGPERALDWIVVGGESGPGARPFDLAWARSTIEQTRQTPCRVFVKQLGAKPIADHTNVRGLRWRQVDPRDHGHGDDHVRVRLTDRKGGDMSEWPEHLRVREWPEVRNA